MYTSIKPGQVWLDTNGKRIQAHGGAMYFEDDTFYWYGENKENTDGKNGVWTWGLRCYSSKDMYNWRDEGLFIRPELEDESSPLHPSSKLDRPHIIFNNSTGKYVCWVKISGEPACYIVLTADRFLGPYTLVRDKVRPYGRKSGDFDIAKDEQTGKAYLYFEGNHDSVIAAELTADYLDVTDKHTTQYEGLFPPFCREAPAHFQHNGLHYLLTSGMTGYIPNPSEAAVAKDWLGPFMPQGDPHRNDPSSASFNSQISYVFRHPKKPDLYIAMADRWVPEFEVTGEIYDRMKRAIASRFSDEYEATMEEKQSLRDTPMLGTANTSIANYVWLPLRFEGNRAVIEWQDEWRVEDF